MEDAASILEQIRLLLELIMDRLGAAPTVALAVSVLVLLFLFRVYQVWRKDKEVHLAIEAHQQALQRCANENRELRIVLLRQIAGWTDDEIDRYIMKADFRDPKESRRAVEGRKRHDRPEGVKPKAARRKGHER
jgi:hypothetical protein